MNFYRVHFVVMTNQNYHTTIRVGVVYIQCHSCGADGPPTEFGDEAANLWNTRIESQPL